MSWKDNVYDVEPLDKDKPSEMILKQFGIKGLEKQLRMEMKNFSDIEEFQVNILIKGCSKNALRRLHKYMRRKTLKQLQNDKLFEVLCDTIEWYEKQGINMWLN